LYRNDAIDYLTQAPDELLVSYHLPAVNGWRASSFRPAKPMDNTDFTLGRRKETVRVYGQRALEEVAGKA
jgi:hypothetical protein